MSEVEKLIADMAARFMVARIQSGGGTNDTAYARQCLELARAIVNGARK
ncbi:hypothetical protein JF540_22850 [Salipiger thiooxidans]|nr:hypothetical protein [Salipiger thiooxidans]MBN8189529.1 hypothetical protein [Salipiger thiooxidans]